MLDVVPEAVAAVMPHCCGGADRLQKKRGHLAVDLFFFLSLSFAFFHQSLINNRQNPWGKASQPAACCKYSRKWEVAGEEGRKAKFGGFYF